MATDSNIAYSRKRGMWRSFGCAVLRAICVAALLPAATACSVGLALDGEDQPDLSILKPGVERTRIEAELGQPNSVVALDGGRTQSTYYYEIGNESSGGRAAVHAGMDVLTLGLWELVGTPMEAMQGEDMKLVVTYDSAGKAESFDVSKRDDDNAPASARAPSHRVGAQR